MPEVLRLPSEILSRLPRKRAAKLGKPPVWVVFGNGAWHNDECWEEVQPLLNANKINTLAVDLPGQNPFKTFDANASKVASKMRAKGIVRAVRAAAIRRPCIIESSSAGFIKAHC